MRHNAVRLFAMTLAGAVVVALVASWSLVGAVIVALPLCLAVGLEASASSTTVAGSTAVDMKAAALGHAVSTHRAEVHQLDALRAAKSSRETVEHEELAPVLQLVPRDEVRDEQMRAHG